MSFEREERYSVVKLEGIDGEGESALKAPRRACHVSERGSCCGG